jgi:hypothetical protein
VLLA